MKFSSIVTKSFKGSLLFIIASLAFCSQPIDETEQNSELLSTEALQNITKIKFEEESYNFGQIIEGEKVNHIFKFKNMGSHDLIIGNAKGSCGCTVPSFPKKPISPGKSGEIKVMFNSENRIGFQKKKVYITSNTDPVQTELSIEAEVLAK